MLFRPETCLLSLYAHARQRTRGAASDEQARTLFALDWSHTTSLSMRALVLRTYVTDAHRLEAVAAPMRRKRRGGGSDAAELSPMAAGL